MKTETTDTAAALPVHTRPRRRWPPLKYWLFLLILAAVNVWAQVSDRSDPAIANVVVVATTFIGFFTLLVWLAWFSGHAPAVRWTPIGVFLTGVIAWFGTHRIDAVQGGLVPTSWSWRWSPRPDQLLKPPDIAEHHAAVPLAVTTADDFPQFLGPNRDSGLDGIRLDADWQTHPPRRLWRQAIGAGHSGFAAVNGYAVTLEQRGPEELVTCYDALTGEAKWSHAVLARHAEFLGGIGPRSTPTIDEGRVYALGATGILRCLNGADGKLLWNRNLLEECNTTEDEDAKNVMWGRAASPLIVDKLVIVPGGGPTGGPYISLLAFDKETGRRVWQGGDRQISYCSPSLAQIGGMKQILIVNEDNITGHDPTNGAVLWNYPWLGSSHAAANNSQVLPAGKSPTGENRLFISKGYGGGCALFTAARDEHDHWTAKTIWTQPRELRTKFSNVTIHDGSVYGLSETILECVDLVTGQRRWKAGRFDYGQILRVGDFLLVESEAGEIALVDAAPKEFHELGRFEAVEGKTWNPLCLWGRYLLVRNSQQAACYELPLAHRLPTARYPSSPLKKGTGSERPRAFAR
jgi:outer membrane protein assembly factor BamB